MMDWLLRLALLALLAYGTLAAYAALFANSRIFQAPPSSYAETDVALWLDEQVAALWLPPAEPDSFVMLYCHGNAEDLGDCRPFLKQLHANGYGVFAFDYPGYGQTPGKPSEAACHASAASAYRYLTQTLGVPQSRIILYGRSLGSGPATRLATDNNPAGLIHDVPLRAPSAS